MASGPVLLIYAPPSDPTQSYTSLPVLTGYLRSRGFEVVQRDLGIEVLDELLTPARVHRAWLQSRAAAAGPAGRRDGFAERFHRASLFAPYVIEKVAEAKRVMRDRVAFYDLDRYRWATNVINLACDLVSLPYHPAQLTPSKYEQGVDFSVAGVLGATGERSTNIFLDLFENGIADDLLRCQPALIGISITYHFQVIPGFTLARVLKRRAPHIPVVIGGAIIARMESHLLSDPRLFDIADHFIVGEGESALHHLAAAVTTGERAAAAPNLISLVNGRPHASDTSHVEDLKTLSPPDFGGLELDRYLSPEPVLLLSTSRGCYWGKCTFCDVSRQTRTVYRPFGRTAVVRDMLDMRRKYGARRFFFCDDAVPLGTMREIAQMVQSEFPDATWQAEVRLEKGFTREFIHDLKRGGCRQLMFGFESSSQRMLDKMVKNNTLERDHEIIRDCAEAGIALNLQTFIGLPTETRAEADQTVKFLIEHERYLSSIGFGVFSLWKETPIYNEPEKHGVTAISIPLQHSLISECEFETLSGMSRAEAFAAYEAAMERIGPIFATRSRYVGGAAGSHSLLHLSEYRFTELRDYWQRHDQRLDVTGLMDRDVEMGPVETSAATYAGPGFAFVPATGQCLAVGDAERALIERCRHGGALGEIVGAPGDDLAALGRYAHRMAMAEGLIRQGILRLVEPQASYAAD